MQTLRFGIGPARRFTLQSVATLRGEAVDYFVRPLSSSEQAAAKRIVDTRQSTLGLGSSVFNTALSLPGGNVQEEQRALQHRRIEKELKELQLSEYSKIAADDVAWVNSSTAFVGTGQLTNVNGVRQAIDRNVFQTDKVVTVRDVFERNPKRQALNTIFRVISDDVTLMLSSIQRGPTRRLCNEYIRVKEPNGGNNYVLVRHDVDFVEYLHECGLRIVPVNSQEQLGALNLRQVPLQQSTNHVLMVAPTAFHSNADAALDNHFMNGAERHGSDPVKLQRKVVEEFEKLHAKLTSRGEGGAGLRVHLFTHEPHHDTPDAVFPNNWFSTHTDLEVGECTLVLYPMKAPSRRKERRPDFVDRLHSFHRYTSVYDLTRQEEAVRPKFLEGTGSLVLDRINKVAYAALSERTDLGLAQTWGRVMGYTIVPFHSTDGSKRPIYHTNVMMSIGTKVAVLCSESVDDKREREHVLDMMRSTGHEVVQISREQMNRFCGNVLEVENYYGQPVMAMSTQAYNAFTPEQRDTLNSLETDLVHADITTLESIGGGGVRCSIGELF